jgi:hypothetical protein
MAGMDSSFNCDDQATYSLDKTHYKPLSKLVYLIVLLTDFDHWEESPAPTGAPRA